MSYEDAFAAVPGVTVEWAEYCGSYEGRLIAKLRIDGETEPRYILDYYGSCSGCDAYQAEMPSNPTPELLAAFGKPYVDASLTLEEVLNELLPQPGQWYDDDVKEALSYVLKDYPDMADLLARRPEGSG